jgi:hypothetical protein
VEHKLRVGDLVEGRYSKCIGIILSFEADPHDRKRSFSFCRVLVQSDILHFPEKNLKKIKEDKNDTTL